MLSMGRTLGADRSVGGQKHTCASVAWPDENKKQKTQLQNQLYFLSLPGGPRCALNCSSCLLWPWNSPEVCLGTNGEPHVANVGHGCACYSKAVAGTAAHAQAVWPGLRTGHTGRSTPPGKRSTAWCGRGARPCPHLAREPERRVHARSSPVTAEKRCLHALFEVRTRGEQSNRAGQQHEVR
jgi:hypothetical protein